MNRQYVTMALSELQEHIGVIISEVETGRYDEN